MGADRAPKRVGSTVRNEQQEVQSSISPQFLCQLRGYRPSTCQGQWFFSLTNFVGLFKVERRTKLCCTHRSWSRAFLILSTLMWWPEKANSMKLIYTRIKMSLSSTPLGALFEIRAMSWHGTLSYFDVAPNRITYPLSTQNTMSVGPLLKTVLQNKLRRNYFPSWIQNLGLKKNNLTKSINAIIPHYYVRN